MSAGLLLQPDGTAYWVANAELRFPIINTGPDDPRDGRPRARSLFFDVTRVATPGYLTEFYVFDEPTPTARPCYRVAKALGSFGSASSSSSSGCRSISSSLKQLHGNRLGEPFKITGVGSYMTKFWIGFDF